MNYLNSCDATFDTDNAISAKNDLKEDIGFFDESRELKYPTISAAE